MSLEQQMYVKSVEKAEQLRECLRSIKQNHQDDEATVKKAFETLLIYVGNVARNPDVEMYRKIRISNPAFQSRVGRLIGGIEFLGLCGFEIIEEGKLLYLPGDKVDMAVLNSAGSELKSAITNPFFGLISRPYSRI
ncbi:UBX domain-containing protein 6 [Linum perenne]